MDVEVPVTATPAPQLVEDEKGNKTVELGPIAEASWIQTEVVTLNVAMKWPIRYRFGFFSPKTLEMVEEAFEGHDVDLSMLAVLQIAELEDGPPVIEIVFDVNGLDRPGVMFLEPLPEGEEVGSLHSYLKGLPSEEHRFQEAKNLTRQLIKHFKRFLAQSASGKAGLMLETTLARVHTASFF